MEADNARADLALSDRAATAKERADRIAAGAHLFQTMHPEMTPAQAEEAAKADPTVVDRLFNTLADNKRADATAAEKTVAARERADAAARDEQAYQAIVKSRRENRDLTDEEAKLVGGSKWGATTYEKRAEGAANRSSREMMQDKGLAQRREDSAVRRGDALRTALKRSSLTETKVLRQHAETDLREWMDLHHNDYPTAQEMSADPEYKQLVKNVQDAQTAEEKRVGGAASADQQALDEVQGTLDEARGIVPATGQVASAPADPGGALPPAMLARIPAKEPPEGWQVWFHRVAADLPKAEHDLLLAEVNRRAEAK